MSNDKRIIEGFVIGIMVGLRYCSNKGTVCAQRNDVLRSQSCRCCFLLVSNVSDMCDRVNIVPWTPSTQFEKEPMKGQEGLLRIFPYLGVITGR